MDNRHTGARRQRVRLRRSPSGETSPIRLSFACTEHEASRIATNAAAEGVSVSEWLRRAAITPPPQPEPEIALDLATAAPRPTVTRLGSYTYEIVPLRPGDRVVLARPRRAPETTPATTDEETR